MRKRGFSWKRAVFSGKERRGCFLSRVMGIKRWLCACDRVTRGAGKECPACHPVGRETSDDQKSNHPEFRARNQIPGSDVEAEAMHVLMHQHRCSCLHAYFFIVSQNQ